MIKRLDRLDVATSDLNDACSVYERNFGFKVTRLPGSESATVTVGGAEIRLTSGALAAEALKSSGEGMTGLWLEAEDLDDVVSALKKAGLKVGEIRNDQGRRVLALDPNVTGRVPLFIFDSKA